MAKQVAKIKLTGRLAKKHLTALARNQLTLTLLCERSKTVKDARIVFTKIVAYLNILQEKGTAAGMPMLRHIQDDIWELRPLSYRILFAKEEPDRFVLLHHFRKTTKKTPKKELEKAIRELTDYKRRRQ